MRVSQAIQNSGLEAGDARWLMSELLGCSLLDVSLHGDQDLDESVKIKFFEWAQRRITGEPLQYIVGAADFHDIRLKVDSRVLIPRPETEQLVQLVLESESEDKQRFLDIGTGSGAIALALKHARLQWVASASDLSEDALAVAWENARQNKLPVEFRSGAGLLPWQGDSFDFMVSNPPYLSKELDQLGDGVAAFEPSIALFSDDNGASVADDLIQQAVDRVCSIDRLYFELSARVAYALERKWRKKVRRLQRFADLNDRKRFLFIQL